MTKPLITILILFLAGCTSPTETPPGANKTIKIEVTPTPSKDSPVMLIRSPNDIKTYLDDGGDPGAKHAEGWPLLLGAVKAGRLEVVRALINARADVNARHQKGRNTALHYLAWSTSIDTSIQLKIGALLLEAGADVNARNKKGQTALMLASLQGSIEFVRFLLSRSGNPGLFDESSRSAERYARDYGHTDIAELLRAGDPE